MKQDKSFSVKTAFLLLTLVSVCPVSTLPDLRMLSAIRHHRHMHRLHFLCKLRPNNLGYKREIMQILGIPVKVSDNITALDALGDILDEDVIICWGDYDSEEINALLSLSLLKAARRDWLIWITSGQDSLNQCCAVTFNQRIFFVSEESSTLYEHYSVNNVTVHNDLARLDCEKHPQRKCQYLVLSSTGFLERRSNLQGLPLKAMTSSQYPYIIMRPPVNMTYGFESTASGDRMKDITNHPIGGMFLDVGNILRQEMNFTLSLFMREDKLWGHVWPNGSWSGMISTLLKGEADFILASATLNPQRFTVVDFLHPIGRESIAVFVTEDSYEEHGWLSFLYPFRPDLWMVLLFNMFFVLIAYKSFEVFYCSVNFPPMTWAKWLMTALGDLWMIVSSYAGNKTEEKPVHKKTSLRLFLIVIFLSGSIVFMTYRASLTAELSARRYVKPFSSLAELVDSDYR